ncbi:6,7-dimethyl-8-ribityllumazine synthase [Candidimonas nitroreducens]|uniref:6,7-dimethyl-8-ribityllumazine synthase n=1 Tax=Candidimonas nitroreducens TaxID=683354 RepID=A0A225MAY4_9BURK|nr:6,7-dimethyl-8-ribityllumazine synthase [Candidimonas nitroreducens]OWT56139.1 6,7-dimethyl-8-ribityllumazine synthase [Candidimonas nitroreducens]
MCTPETSLKIPLVDDAACGAVRVAFVQSCWHRDIVDECREAFCAALRARSVAQDTIDLFEVPGAFELPLHVQQLARSGHYDAVVAAGFVVDGGIYRHEFVAQAVLDGLMQVQLASGVPVLSAVLTPQRFNAQPEHVAFFRSHMQVKGAEAAHACIATVASLRALQGARLAAGAAPGASFAKQPA